MFTSNESISVDQRKISSNGHQRNQELSSRHAGEDCEVDMNGQNGMDLERDDREVGGEGHRGKMAVRGGNGVRERDIGLGLSNHFNSDDLPSPYLRTQFPPHHQHSHYASSQKHTSPAHENSLPRPTAYSPIKSTRSPSPAHSIPPASPLQAHIALAAAPPPPKPRYTQPAPSHDSSSRPYNAYVPGQGSSRPIASTVQENGPRAGSRKDGQEDYQAGEVLPSRKALGNLWKRDIPTEASIEEAGLGEDMEMTEDKEDMELDELESEADKGDLLPPVVPTAAVPKPRSARATRNRKPGKNASGKKDKEKEKAKEVEEDKENLDVRTGDKEVKGEFAYEYVAISQRKEGRQNM